MLEKLNLYSCIYVKRGFLLPPIALWHCPGVDCHQTYIIVCCLGFEISEYQKRQAAMTVRKVTKQKGEATRRYQVIFLFFSLLVCSVFSSLFTLPSTCFLFLLSTPSLNTPTLFMNGLRLSVYWDSQQCQVDSCPLALLLSVFSCWVKCLSAHTMTWFKLKQLLSINEKTEGCLHGVLSLKGDISVHDMWVLCHTCLDKLYGLRKLFVFYFSFFSVALSPSVDIRIVTVYPKQKPFICPCAPFDCNYSIQFVEL